MGKMGSALTLNGNRRNVFSLPARAGFIVIGTMMVSVSLQGRVNILIKGKLLFRYDGKNAKGFDGTPEHAKERELWQNKYDKFKEDIMNHLKEINPGELWETKSYPPSWVKRGIKDGMLVEKDEEAYKFKISDYDEFNSKLVILEDDASAFLDGWNIDVYAYGGREGVLVETIQTAIHSSLLLKACKYGFHRDWDHNAVCVQNTRQAKEINGEERAEREHDRAIKRHQDYAESGGEY